MKDSTRFEIRIAGFGGQGVVTIGKVLGHAFTIHEAGNPEKCNGCGICEIVCPDFAVAVEKEDKPCKAV